MGADKGNARHDTSLMELRLPRISPAIICTDAENSDALSPPPRD